MLPDKHITTKAHRQKSKFVTVIHPEHLSAIKTTEENSDKRLGSVSQSDRTFLISWLFLIGSLMFLFDGFIELSEGFSIHVLLHITASAVFTIASALFIPKK